MLLTLLPLFLASAIDLPQARDGLVRRLTGGYYTPISSLEFFVDPDGLILDCRNKSTQTVISGFERICDRAIGWDMGRGARDHLGNPIHSVVDGEEMYGPGSRFYNPALLHPDLVVSVAAMPGEQERMRTSATVVINEAGTASHCEGGTAFSDAACQQVTMHNFRVRLDANGAAVPYADSLIVDFVLERGS